MCGEPGQRERLELAHLPHRRPLRESESARAPSRESAFSQRQREARAFESESARAPSREGTWRARGVRVEEGVCARHRVGECACARVRVRECAFVRGLV